MKRHNIETVYENYNGGWKKKDKVLNEVKLFKIIIRIIWFFKKRVSAERMFLLYINLTRTAFPFD